MLVRLLSWLSLTLLEINGKLRGPRNARVESVHPDENNVRTACVRSVAGKVYEHHVTKLVALELE